MGQCFALRLFLSTKSASSSPYFIVTLLLLPTNDRHQQTTVGNLPQYDRYFVVSSKGFVVWHTFFLLVRRKLPLCSNVSYDCPITMTIAVQLHISEDRTGSHYNYHNIFDHEERCVALTFHHYSIQFTNCQSIFNSRRRTDHNKSVFNKYFFNI